MPANIDERIVAAKFDASDFEKGVNKTLKKLDELKKSFDLKDATKSIKELGDKTKESTDSMGKSLDKLTDRLTTFTGMIKQRILGGLADEVAGVFLRMEQSVKSFIKAISTDQISSGLYKYQQILTSVRVMMSSGQNLSQSDSYRAINDLTEYVDQTSYSLTQMTDALSKMVAAGVNLDEATKSVQGIANACANAGINAQDASRAFYNLAQAYGKGVLQYTDYKSLELLNMTNKSFKENLLEAATEAQTLKKVGDGIYQTTNKIDKKVKSGKKVTTDNLTDMLRYDFVNKDVMNKLFGKIFYFTEKELDKVYDDLGIDKYDTTEEQRNAAYAEAKKRYGDLAVQAYLAAKEARSFTDVMNTLKDVVSTGWAKSFEYIFGKLESAAEFFTKLTEGQLAQSIYRIGEWRNAVLEVWSIGEKSSGKSGATMLRDSIVNITDALGTLIKMVQDILGINPDAEDSINDLGMRLTETTRRLKDTTEEISAGITRFRNAMNEPAFKDGPTRVQLIQQTLSNLASVFGIVGKVASVAFNLIGKAFDALEPVIDGMLEFLAVATQPIANLKESDKVFKDLENTGSNLLTVIKKLVTPLEKIMNFAGQIASFILSMAIDTVTSNIEFLSDVLGLFLELITGKSAQLENGEGILERIKNDFEGIKTACSTGLATLKEFFNALLGDLRKLLGLSNELNENGEESGIFSGLTSFFENNQFIKDAEAWVNQAIIDVGDFIKSIPSRVRQFGANVYDTLYNLIFTKERVRDVDDNGRTVFKTVEILTPIGKWLDQAIKDIKDFVLDIPNKIISAVGTVTSWIDDIFNSIFGIRTDSDNNKISEEKADEANSLILSNFDEFINTVKLSVSNWFADLPNKISSALSGIGNFFATLIAVLDEFLFGKKATVKIRDVDDNGRTVFKTVSTRIKSGFSLWLDGVIKEARKFIENIPEYIKKGIKGAGDIVTTIVSALFGKPAGEEVKSADLEKKIEKPFLGINLTKILDHIKDIGRTLLNQIARIFTGSEDVETNMEWFSGKVAEGIEWIRTNAKIALDKVLEFIKKIPSKIASIFTGEKTKDAEQSEIGKSIVEFGNTIGTFLTVDLPAAIDEFINDAIDAIDAIWTKLYDDLVGEKAPIDGEEAAKDMEKAVDAPADAPTELSGWSKFVERLGNTFSHLWEKLPTWIAEGLELAIGAIDQTLQTLGKWISGIGITDAAAEAADVAVEEGIEAGEKAAKVTSDAVKDGVTEATKDAEPEEEPRLVTAVKKIGERLRDLFVQTIPTFLNQVWDKIKSAGTIVWTSVSNIFSGKPQTDFENEVIKFGDTIKTFITTTLPQKIKEAFEWISKLFSKEEVPLPPITKPTDYLSKKYPSMIKGYTDGGENLKKDLKDAQKKVNKDLNDAVEEDSGFWSFASEIGTAISNAFLSIGPKILDGISSALDFLGKIGDILIDVLTGDKTIGEIVEDKYKDKGKDLRASLVKVGNSLKDFFLDTIPKLIGSAIGALITHASEWFGKLFEGINAAAKKEAKDAGGGGSHSFDEAETVEETAQGMMDIVWQFLEKVGSIFKDNGVQAIVTIIAIGFLIGHIKRLFSLLGETEAVADSIKWTAMALAFTALISIFTTIGKLATSGDDHKVQTAMDILDKLGAIVEKIAWIVGLLTVGKVAEALSSGDVADKVTKALGKNGTKSLGDTLLNGFNNFFESFGKLAGVGAGTYIAGSLAGAGINSLLTSVGDAVSSLTADVTDVINMVAPFVKELTDMNDDLDSAIDSVGKIATLFERIYNAFGNLYEKSSGLALEKMYEDDTENSNGFWAGVDESGRIMSLNTNENIAGMEAYMKGLNERIELFINLSTFINVLADALSKLDNIDDVETRMDNLNAFLGKNGTFTTFLTNLLNALDTASKNSKLEASNYWSRTYFNERNSGIALALDMLASSLSVFKEGIAGLDENSVTALDKSLDVFGRLAEAFRGVKVEESSLTKAFFGNSTISKIGSQIKLFGWHLKDFYKYLSEMEGFDNGDTDKTNRKISSVVSVARQFSSIIREMIGYGSSTEFLNSLSETLPGFAGAVSTFILNVNRAINEGDPDMTLDRSQMILNYVDAFSKLMSGVNDLHVMFSTYNADEIQRIIQNMSTAFTNPQNNNAFAASVLSIHQALSKTIESALKDDETITYYHDVGSGIAQLIAEGIQIALDTDESLRIRITPVIEDSSVRDQLSQTYGVGGTVGIDWTRLNTEVSSALSKTSIVANNDYAKHNDIIDTIAAIKELGERGLSAKDLTDAMAGIEVRVDSEALVGALASEIDRQLGERLARFENKVAV